MSSAAIPIEQRHELRIVQRLSVDVGVDLHSTEAMLTDGAMKLGESGVDVVQRQTRGGANEPLGIGKRGPPFRHWRCAEVQRFSGTGKMLHGRIRCVDDLHVTLAGDVHRAEPCVQIEQRGDRQFLLPQTHCGGAVLSLASR